MRFTGSTHISVVFNNTSPSGAQFLFMCQVDGSSEKGIWPESSTSRLTIATDLDASEEHTVFCGRSSEAFNGETSLLRIEADAGVQALLPPGPFENELRYEAIGDSISSGLDVFKTWVRRLADSWATSDWRTVARSGGSVTQATSHEKTMKEHWLCRRYALFGEPCPAEWSFATWQADVVTINLGTNDFFLSNPSEAAFTAAYRDLIAQVRGRYPGALIMCIAPLIATCPQLGKPWGTMVNSISAAVTEINDNKVRFYATGSAAEPWLSCDTDYADGIHPTPGGHAKFAKKLLEVMTTDVRSFFPSKCSGSGDHCDGTASIPPIWTTDVRSFFPWLCQDTPNWSNGHHSTCHSYHVHFCANGALKSGSAGMGGNFFNNPEENCCSCGKGNRFVASTPSPTNTPSSPTSPPAPTGTPTNPPPTNAPTAATTQAIP